MSDFSNRDFGLLERIYNILVHYFVTMDEINKGDNKITVQMAGIFIMILNPCIGISVIIILYYFSTLVGIN